MTVPVTVGAGRELAAALLTAAGVPEGPAARTAQLLVLSDAWGVRSHGLLRLPYYLRRIAAGGIRPDAALQVAGGDGAVQAFDGQGGLGHWQLWDAAERAARLSAEHGIAAVAVGNSSHCGVLGAYTLPALNTGQAALVFSNGPAVMPPWGGTRPLLSTSPLAAGVPCGSPPLIVDLATTAVARGRIADHAARNVPLAPGWAFAADGTPTVDPAVALRGMLAPLGGAKGYALALAVEALTGGIVGPALSGDVPDMFDADADAVPQRIAHLVLTLDPARLDVDGRATERLAALARAAADAGGRLPGAQRRLPEHIDDAEPLDLLPATLTELRSWTQRLGVPETVIEQAAR